jgi:hypothetical protein
VSPHLGGPAIATPARRIVAPLAAAALALTERREREVVVRLHHVGEAQADDLRRRVPAAEVVRHLLLDRLAQGV